MYKFKKRYIRWLIFFVMLLNLGSRYNVIAQVVYNPSFERSAYEVALPHVDKVEINKDIIDIYCSIYFDGSWGYNIPKTMYLEDTNNKKKYQIIKCEGLPFEPEERLSSYGGTFQFIFSFPYVKGLEKFNLVENSADKTFSERLFDIYGIDLLKTNNIRYEEQDYKRFRSMSDFYKSANDRVKYLEFEEKELEAAHYLFGTKSIAAAACYQQIAIIYDEMCEYEMALNYDLQTLECDSLYYGVINKDYPIYAQTLDRISDLYLKIGNNRKYYQLSEKSINVWRSIGNAKLYTNALLNVLLTGSDADGIRKRFDIVQKELDNLPSFIDKESQLLVDVYKIMASHYSIIEENEYAVKYCDKVLNICMATDGEASYEYAENLGLKCKYLQRNGQYAEAIIAGEVAKHIIDSLNVKTIKYAELLGDLANLYSQKYDYEKSIHLQLNALNIFEEAKDWLAMSGVYCNIANYFQSSEDLDNAEVYIKKAIELLDNHDVREYIVSEVERTGNNLIDNPSVQASIKQLIFHTKANFLQELARIYEKEGRISDAIIIEKEHGELIKEMDDEQMLLNEHMYTIHFLTLSRYFLKDKQYENAIDCVKQSLNSLENDENPDVAMHNLHNLTLTQIYMEKNDIEKAIQYAEKTVSNSVELNMRNIRFASQPLLSYLYWKSGDYKDAESNMSEVLNLLQDTIRSDIAGMTMGQKQRMWDKYQPHFQLYRNIIEKSEKSDELLSKLYNYILFSKSLLLDSEIDNDGKEISRLSVNWRDIQRKLSNKDIAIEFMSTAGDSIYHIYHALIVDKTSDSPHMITLYNESDLELLRQTSTQNIVDIVGNYIWSPILELYKHVENMYFSPDGILNVLPIEYSKVDGIGEMMEHYNLCRLSSTKEIVFHNKELSKNNAILYGGLDYDMLAKDSSNCKEEKRYSLLRSINARGGFDPLMSTFEEVNEICDLLKNEKVSTTLYTGVDGTEDSFKNLSGKDINMIHLSTHGMYIGPNIVEQRKKENNFDFLELITNEKDPVKEDIVLTHSFLVMSGGNKHSHREIVESGMNDGILTAFEISQTDLSKVDLVVLSACETGLGDIDNGGVYGLQRGFKKAGANTILMSLDKVDDEATKILMVEFYKNLMSGKSKHQSLKDAQKHLRQVDNGKYDKPEYWASFIMLDGLN